MNRSDLVDWREFDYRKQESCSRRESSPAAYYLCGYAVDGRLKACIAKQTRRYDFPDKKQGQQELHA